MEESRIERAIDYITKLFQGNGDGHDLAHSLRVYHNAMMIAEMETGTTWLIACGYTKML